MYILFCIYYLYHKSYKITILYSIKQLLDYEFEWFIKKLQTQLSGNAAEGAFFLCTLSYKLTMSVRHFQIIFLENSGSSIPSSRGIRAHIADQLSLMALAGSFAAGCLSNAGDEAGIPGSQFFPFCWVFRLAHHHPPLKNANHSAKSSFGHFSKEVQFENFRATDECPGAVFSFRHQVIMIMSSCDHHVNNMVSNSSSRVGAVWRSNSPGTGGNGSWGRRSICLFPLLRSARQLDFEKKCFSLQARGTVGR